MHKDEFKNFIEINCYEIILNHEIKVKNFYKK